jgi:UDP-N-acetyl-D-mannosaminuronate dehydrogenase
MLPPPKEGGVCGGADTRSSGSATSVCLSRWASRASSRTSSASTSTEKVEELKRGYDRNHEVSKEAELKSSTLRRTSDQAALKDRTFFVVAVPTPVDKNNVPDLTPVVKASETVGKRPQEGRRGGLRVDGLPGVTEDICGPILARSRASARSGLQARLLPGAHQPGRHEHTLERIVKVVSGEDEADAGSGRRRLRRHHRRRACIGLRASRSPRPPR